MGNKEAKVKRVSSPAEPSVDKSAVVRGIDWNEIFRKRPDLEPPGYREASKASGKTLELVSDC